MVKTDQGATTRPPSPYRSKLEARYAALLDALREAGQIHDWRYEPVKFRLGKPGRRCWYTIDFVVVTASGMDWVIEYHAVTGRTRDDARVKIETVANLYPWWDFVIIRDGPTGWTREEVG